MSQTHGWLPEIVETAGPARSVHYVPEEASTVEGGYGIHFVALCGAACYPLYGEDSVGRTARHARCETCEGETPPPRRVTPPPWFRVLVCAALIFPASCSRQVEQGVASGVSSSPPSVSTPVADSKPIGYLSREGCGVVIADEIRQLLKENIDHPVHSHSVDPMGTIEVLTCMWTGTSKIPGRDIGVHGRSLELVIDLMHDPDEPVKAAAEFYAGKFSSRGGWTPTELAGTNRAVVHVPKEGRDLELLSVGFQVDDVVVYLSYMDASATQQEVEDATLDLAKRLADRFRG